MKRSEMRTIIWNAIAYGPMDGNPAEDVLIAIEKAGMLPPPWTAEGANDKGLFNEWESRAKELYDIFEWEPEDEKK